MRQISLKLHDLDKDGYENSLHLYVLGHKFSDQFDVDASILVVNGEMNMIHRY